MEKVKHKPIKPQEVINQDLLTQYMSGISDLFVVTIDVNSKPDPTNPYTAEIFRYSSGEVGGHISKGSTIDLEYDKVYTFLLAPFGFESGNYAIANNCISFNKSENDNDLLIADDGKAQGNYWCALRPMSSIPKGSCYDMVFKLTWENINSFGAQISTSIPIDPIIKVGDSGNIIP